MAGYSGTPMAKKLGLKPGLAVALVGAPANWSIPDADPAQTVRRGLRGQADVVIAFVRSGDELHARSRALVDAIPADGALWVVWPRKAAGHVSDLTEQALRDELLPSGLVDTKVAALDQDWSGLRFVWRRDHRAAVLRRRRA